MNAAIKSPQWPRMRLTWTYDEHGGYYDHVVPAAATIPDLIPPMLSSGDIHGQFDVTGIRVPTVAASPYCRPGSVSNVPHDHTSIIASIAAKWNLPAFTYRDAQAPTLFDYVDFKSAPRMLVPPTLASPSKPAAFFNSCATSGQPVITSPNVSKPKHDLVDPNSRR